MAAPIISAVVVTLPTPNISATFNTDIPAVTVLEWGPRDPAGLGTDLNLYYSVSGPLALVHALSQATVYDGSNAYYYKITATNPFTNESSFVTGNAVSASTVLSALLIKTDIVPEPVAQISYFFNMVYFGSGVSVAPKTWTSYVEWSTDPNTPFTSGPSTVLVTAGGQYSTGMVIQLGTPLSNTVPVFLRFHLTVVGDIVETTVKEMKVLAADTSIDNLRLHATLRDTNGDPQPYTVEAFWEHDDVFETPHIPGRVAHAYAVCNTPAPFAQGEEQFIMPPSAIMSIHTPDFAPAAGKIKISMDQGFLSIPGLISSSPIRVYDGASAHVALTWDGSFVELLLNGRSVGRVESTFAFSANIDKVELGGCAQDNEIFQGFISSVKVSDVVRPVTDFMFLTYSSDPFTFLPTGPTAPDVNTRLLLLLDGNLLDTSGNGYNATTTFPPTYGGPPIGLNGVTFPAYTPATSDIAVVPTAVFESLPQGTIEFWVQWSPEQAADVELPAPKTAKVTGLRMEEPRYFQVSQVRQEQGFQLNWTPSGYIPFPQTNGQVESVVESEGFLYIGGTFTTVDGFPHLRLARIDLSTNTLDPLWTPSADGTVRSLLVDGDFLYVGGAFGLLNGSPMALVGRLDKGSGALDLAFDAQVVGIIVLTLAQNGPLLYLGGIYTSVNGIPKNGITAVSKVDGGIVMALTPTFITGSTVTVSTILVDQETATVFFGGAFTAVDGSSRQNGASFSLTTGVLFPWNPLANFSINSLVKTTSVVYCGGTFTLLGTVATTSLGIVDAVTGVAFARTYLFPFIRYMQLKNGFLYIAGNGPSLLVVAPSTGVPVLRLLPVIVGASVLTFTFFQDTILFGGVFTSVKGNPQTNLARLYDPTVMQNFLYPVESIPTDAEHLFAAAPAQLQEFSKAELPSRDFSWRKARPLQEEVFRIQWAANDAFSFALAQTFIPRKQVVNISGTPVIQERAVVQDTDNQTLGAVRKNNNNWFFRGRSQHSSIPTWLPVYLGYTGQYSNVAETSFYLNGTIGYFVTEKLVAGTLIVQSADNLTTYVAGADYDFVDGFLSRSALSLIPDGAQVHVTYQRADSLTVQGNWRFRLRDYFNALLPQKFYDRDSKTTNFFKLQDVYGFLFGDLTLNLNQLGYQDRFLETSALNDNPQRYSEGLTLTTQGPPFNVAWLQQAARGMIGATRIGGTQQAARIAARSYTGQACDIETAITGFYIIDDFEDPLGTLDDPDFYVGSDVEEVIQGSFITILGTTIGAIIPAVHYDDPGLIEIVIEDDDQGLVWALNVWDAAYDFNVKSIRSGTGLVPSSIELTLSGTVGPSNVLALNLGVLGENDMSLVVSDLSLLFTGYVGGTMVVSTPGVGTPITIGAALATALFTAINDPLNIAVSTFFEALPLIPGSNVLTIRSKVVGQESNDFSAEPTSITVTVQSPNQLNPAGYLQFQGGSTSKSYTSVANYVAGTVSIIKSDGATVPDTSYVVNEAEGSIAFIAGAPGIPSVNEEFTVVGKAFMGDVETNSRLVIDALKNVMPAYATAGFLLHESNPVDQPREWGVAAWGTGAWGGKHRLVC